MKKTTTYHEGNVSVTVSPEGMLTFNADSYIGPSLTDLYSLLSNEEVIEALGLGPVLARKPQTPDLTTAEGLDALPEGARIVDGDRDTHQKINGEWLIVRWAWEAEDHPAAPYDPRSSGTLLQWEPLTLDKED